MTKEETMRGALMWFELETGVLLGPKKKLCTRALIWFKLWTRGFWSKIFVLVFSLIWGENILVGLGKKHPKATFASAVKEIEKTFYAMLAIWDAQKIRSNRKSHSLTLKYVGRQCKTDYTSILLSNHFQHTEKERERGLKPVTAPSRSPHPPFDVITAIL